MNINKNIKVALMALAAFMATGSMTSCSDEPDSQYFYTFTGEMLSDYISNRDILASCPTTRLWTSICSQRVSLVLTR